MNEQPPITYCVRESWDTGHEDYFVDDFQHAKDLRNDLIDKLAVKVPMAHKQAAKFVSIYAMVRMDV